MTMECYFPKVHMWFQPVVAMGVEEIMDFKLVEMTVKCTLARLENPQQTWQNLKKTLIWQRPLVEKAQGPKPDRFGFRSGSSNRDRP